MPRPHVSDGELVRYHDGTLHDAERCQTIQQHLAHCRECQRRRDAVHLIHPSAEDLMDFHDGNRGNQQTYERVKAHLRDHNCPLCGGWLEALRQAQEEVAQGDEAALWQALSPSPQTTAAVLPPVSPAVTQRLSTRVPRQGEAVECHVQKEANGDRTLVLRGSPPLAGRLVEFALLAEDTGRVCLSGFSVLPAADGALTSTVHVSREAWAARLGHTAVRAVAYPLELADLSIHDVMTLCWSVTMADKATQPAWGALCRRWQKLVPAGSLLHAWTEEVTLALGQDQQDTKATAPAAQATGDSTLATALRARLGEEEAQQPTVGEKAAGVLKGVMTAAAEMVQSAGRRLLPVELWLRPREALASPTPPRGDRQELVVYVEELRALDVEPYIRIALRKQPKRHTVSFVLEPLVDPKHPGRPLEPQRGTIEIHLLRPTPKASVTARLGSRNAEDFRDFSPPETLDDYSEGEERQWQAEVTVAPGATWSPL